MKQNFWKRMVTKQYAQLPIFCFFGLLVPYFLLQSFWKMKTQGSLPQTLQPQYYLYRNNLSMHGHQHNANANPDNHYDRMKNCWTSDPHCGLDVGPKRPWLDLKDPTKNLVKFRRDASEDTHITAIGWKGF